MFTLVNIAYYLVFCSIAIGIDKHYWDIVFCVKVFIAYQLICGMLFTVITLYPYFIKVRLYELFEK